MMKRLMYCLILLMFLSGCSRLMGSLRRDLDDNETYTSPTVGGTWTERGFLADDEGDQGASDRYAAVGHSERGPASSDYQTPAGKGSWVGGGDRSESNRRDQYRTGGRDDDGVAFSNTPSLAPPVKRAYKNGARATRADFVDDAQNEGSLWASDGQTNYYFTKNKIRGVGDIITVAVEQDFYNDVTAEVARTLSPRERETELALAQDRIDGKLHDEPAGKDKAGALASAAAPNRGPASVQGQGAAPGKNDLTLTGEEPASRKATPSDIDVSRSMKFKAGDTTMAEIVERYPNGNYKVRGTKKVPYRNGYKLLNFVAVAKGSDISEEDTVSSGKLYEYRLEIIR